MRLSFSVLATYKTYPGFAIFFAVFDVSRQLANIAAAKVAPPPIAPISTSSSMNDEGFSLVDPGHKPGSHARIAHGIVLVSGGVAAGYGYEIASRPFDNARRLLESPSGVQGSPSIPNTKPLPQPAAAMMLSRIRSEGLLWLFRSVTSNNGTGDVRGVYRALRALGRLGPWGVGFLMWEGLAPDFSN